jgi:hypothetical protein
LLVFRPSRDPEIREYLLNRRAVPTSQDSDGSDASVSFSAIAADIPLSEVYEDVEFESPNEAAERE